jgi:hypothetical protein
MHTHTQTDVKAKLTAFSQINSSLFYVTINYILFEPLLTNQLHTAQSFLRSHQSLSCSTNSQLSMYLESSVPCSQDPATGPNPEPEASSPYDFILFL